ncbi:MAG: thiol:disulfide interchange protein DsbA/DsbL [Burkholderiaceae bacterium]|nr:thiol:disulfide interchange protein DsbA/DsbL [Burkholderiaceae bacterium]
MKRREFALRASSLIAASAAWILPAAGARAQNQIGGFKAGEDFLELETRAPVSAPAPQIEVVEFFSYGCSHCRRFEPIFKKWEAALLKDVAVRSEHIAFGPDFEPLQRIFYTLEIMERLDLQMKVFDAIQSDKKRLDKPDVLLPWIAEQGVDRAKFEQTYKSFGVGTKARRAVQLQDAYQLQGTPAIGVAGRYYIDAGKLGRGFERMLKIVDALIENERKRA